MAQVLRDQIQEVEKTEMYQVTYGSERLIPPDDCPYMFSGACWKEQS